jgi:hypothetical protein
MQQRKRQSTHWYSVYVIAYVDEETRARVERKEEDITQPEQITAQSFYMGHSKPKANAAISRAVLSAANNPLAYAVVMEQDHKSIIRLRVEH